MFSRLSNFVSPLSIFKLNTELPLDLVLSLDSGSASSYNPFSGSIEFFQSQRLECISDDFKFGTNDFTIELWFKWTANAEIQGLITNYYTPLDVGVRLYIDNSGSLTGLMYSDPHFGYVIHETTVTQDTWHHAAVVRQGTTFSVYLDGVGNTDTTGLANLNITENSNLFIGQSFVNLDSQRFLGKITNVRVSNSAVYTGDFTPITEQLQSNGSTSLLLLTLDETSFLVDSNTDTSAKTITGFNSPTFNEDTPITKLYIYPKTWKDLSGNNYTFTFDINPEIIEQFERTIYLPEDNFANSSDFGTLKKFTLDTWVNMKSSVNMSSFFTNAYSDPSDINMFIGQDNSGDIWSGFYKSSGDLFITSTPFTPTLHTWYNFTTTVDSDNLNFYINGVTHSVTALNQIYPASSNLGYIIGKKWADDVIPVPYANANISIINVWSGALTYSVINQNYNNLLDRFTFVLNIDPSNWDASASNITDLRNNIVGTVSQISYSYINGGLLTFQDQSFINFGNPESLNQNGDISFLIWVNFEQFTTAYNTLGKHYGGGQNDFIFSVKESTGMGVGARKMNIYTQNNFGVPGNEYGGLFDDAEINLDTWYLLGFTMENGGDLKYYINGSTSSTFNNVTRNRANINFLLGSPDPNDGITGKVGEVRFYNRVLTDQEILHFYNNTTDRYNPGFGTLVFGEDSQSSKIYSTSSEYVIGTSDFTLESWFKQLNPRQSGIISMRDSGDDGISINLNSNIASSLHSFNVFDGLTSRSSLLYFSGKLYGTTYAGGTYSNGTIFSINIDGTSFETLHDFDGTGGENSWSNLIEYQGVLYGTTYLGGVSNYGLIYKINPDGSSFSVIHEFDSLNGANPASGLLQSGGYLYGTTRLGGDSNFGVIYKVNPSGGSYSVIHTFSGQNGNASFGSLIEFEGHFYSTTFLGGDLNEGVIYKIDSSGSTFSVIHSFNGTEGSNPWSGLLELDGVFYGTTYDGGTLDYGTVFRINPDGTSYSVIHNFDSDGGRYCYSGLVSLAGILYGTCNFGGANSNGVIFSLDTIGNSFSVVYDFDVSIGQGPRSTPIIFESILYGTTNGGGQNNYGGLYKLITTEIQFYINGDISLQSESYQIEVDKWYHSAISRSGLTTSFFLNGAKKIEFSDSNNYLKNEITIGSYYTDTDNYLIQGLISQPRLVIGDSVYTSSFLPNSTASNIINTKFLINVVSDGVIFDNSDFNNLITTNNVGFTSSLPESIVVDGLISFLDASNTLSYNGGSTWYDLSGNNNDATLISGYTFSEDNSGVIEFDGYGILFNPNVASRGEVNLNLSASDCTIIYGTRFLQNTPGYIPSGRSLGGKNANWLLGTWNNSTNQFYTTSAGFVIGGSGNQSDLDWHIYTGVMGSNTQFWDNDNKLVSSDSPNAIGPNGLVLASDGIYGESANCQISFLLVYNRCLSEDEILKTYNYFETRFF